MFGQNFGWTLLINYEIIVKISNTGETEISTDFFVNFKGNFREYSCPHYLETF